MSTRDPDSADGGTAAAIESLLAWEARTRIADFKLGAVPVWRLLRNQYVERDMMNRGVRDRSNHNRPTTRKLGSFGINVLKSIAQLGKVKRYDYLVLGFPRRKRVKEIWIDSFSDPIIDLLGRDSTLCIERPFTGVHSQPAYTQHLLYYDCISFVSTVFGRLFGWPIGFFLRKKVARLNALICQRFEISDSRGRTTTGRMLVRFWVQAACARWILSQVRPKLVFLTSRWVHLPFLYACKRARIAVIELQHGIPNLDSFKYRTTFDGDIDPDLFLTFGEVWVRHDWGLPPSRVLPLGYRYISQTRERRRGSSDLRNGRVMLVSQPEMWSRLSRMFWKVVSAHPSVQFLLKLHPQDTHRWTDRYPVGTAANVEVVETSGVDLYDLFADCSAVVGYNSTVLFEAAFFGLRAGVLNLDGINRCPALDYCGRYNFFELRHPGDLVSLLDADQCGSQEDADDRGNPFFAAFDMQIWRRVLQQAVDRQSA